MALAACGGGLSDGGSSSTPRAVTSTVSVGSDGSTTTVGSTKTTELPALDAVVWAEEVARQEQLVIDETQPAITGLGPYVTYRDGGLAGYLDDQRVLYGDLSSDGAAEAMVPVVTSDGTTTSGAGYLIFAPTPDGPALVGDRAFYQSFGFATTATIENAELVVRHSVGAGWEPACCYSGTVTRRYRTDHTTLIETSAPLETGNLDARTFTLDRYYALLGARNYDAAYALLSDDELKRTAESQWPALFSQAAQISTNMLTTPRADGMVPFRLVMASSDGRTQSWQGGAALAYSAATHSWRIDLLSLQPENV